MCNQLVVSSLLMVKYQNFANPSLTIKITFYQDKDRLICYEWVNFRLYISDKKSYLILHTFAPLRLCIKFFSIRKKVLAWEFLLAGLCRVLPQMKI
jgi:hypothetical protein